MNLGWDYLFKYWDKIRVGRIGSGKSEKAFLKFCLVSLVAEKLHTSPLSVVMIFTRDEFTWISSWAEKGKKEQVKRSVIAAQSWWNTAHLTCGTDMTVDWPVMWALDHDVAWKTCCFEEKKGLPWSLLRVHQSLCFTDPTSILQLISHDHHLISRTEGCISLSDWAQAAFEIRFWVFTKPDHFGWVHTYHRE